jgi:hypothetical protein
LSIGIEREISGRTQAPRQVTACQTSSNVKIASNRIGKQSLAGLLSMFCSQLFPTFNIGRICRHNFSILLLDFDFLLLD